MSGRIRYTEEFKLEAVAKRIGVSSKSFYDWVKQFGDTPDTSRENAAEIRRLKAELRRAIEERDLL